MKRELKVLIYSSPDCAYCYTVKSFLEDNELEYEEINIYEDDEGYEEMKRISKQEDVPVTVIGENIVVGWDKERLKELLEV